MLWSDVVLAIDFIYLFDIDFFKQQIMILEDGNDVYLIFDFLHIFKKCILKH